MSLLMSCKGIIYLPFNLVHNRKYEKKALRGEGLWQELLE